MASFEPAKPGQDFVERGPTSDLMIGRHGDPAFVLPEAARSRWDQLRQRREDAKLLSMPLFDQVAELRIEKQKHEGRLRQLVTLKTSGGCGLRASTDKQPPDDIQVLEVERKIASVSEDMRRKQVLAADRNARTGNVGRLVDRIEEWLRGGRLRGCKVAAVDIDCASLMKRNESEAHALERLRRRLRELGADRHCCESTPWPSSETKVLVRRQIEALAARGEPDLSALVEAGQPIRWPQSPLRLSLVGLAIGAAGETQLTGAAQDTVDDPLALLCWLAKDDLLKRVEKLIVESSDDKAALGEQARAEQLAQIASDYLQIEREECQLIWKLQSDGHAVEHRSDVDVRAVLGVELVVDDRPEGPFGPAPDPYRHVIDLISRSPAPRSLRCLVGWSVLSRHGAGRPVAAARWRDRAAACIGEGSAREKARTFRTRKPMMSITVSWFTSTTGRASLNAAMACSGSSSAVTPVIIVRPNRLASRSAAPRKHSCNVPRFSPGSIPILDALLDRFPDAIEALTAEGSKGRPSALAVAKIASIQNPSRARADGPAKGDCQAMHHLRYFPTIGPKTNETMVQQAINSMTVICPSPCLRDALQ
ncbi:MAG: hypothetical protein K0Q64_650 [Nitrobacter vulgaris]|nr:hypothetical protein [Nitrobacter vulgaris]